jgi:betaine-homocysteine S-methyltransferase
MARDILESLKQGFVLGDGGYLEEAKFRGYSTPRVIVEFPEALRLIHQDFFRAGSQVLQALTWWTTRKYLKERGENQGWENRVEEINQTAIRLARQVAGDEALVAGCLCASDYRPHVFDPNDRAMCDRARAGWVEQIAVGALSDC